MKRVIPILAALCLVVAMAVPALADDVYTLSGEYKICGYPSVYGGVTASVNFIFRGISYVKFDWPYRQTTMKFYSNSTSYDSYLLSEFIGQIIDFGDEPQIVNESFYNYITTYGEKIIYPCDVSTCSSVDADGDGYCDNCGGFFTPPPPGPLVEVMTDLKEQNQLSQVLMPVVTMIPIGLGCWVGYKGLRKAWDLFRNVLHQA